MTCIQKKFEQISENAKIIAVWRSAIPTYYMFINVCFVPFLLYLPIRVCV